jgi:predicted acetyltransferase
MILRELEFKDQEAFGVLLDNWDGAAGFNMLFGIIAEMNFQGYLDILRESKEGLNLPVGHVPSTALFGFVGNEIVGKVSIRHYLNDHLEKVGGHIGYGVLPAHRSKGFASMMLKDSLKYCKGLGLSKVLVTCDESNSASVKVIVKNGGILENVYDPKDGSSNKMRFWITFQSS